MGARVTATDSPPGGERTAQPTKRERDISDAVVARFARPVLIARLPPESLDAEAYARQVGNWGNHSAFLGARWEEVVARWAAGLVGTTQVFHGARYRVAAAVPLDSQAELRQELSRLGLSCPDLVLVAIPREGAIALLPLDSKVSLDTASLDQVQALRLTELATYGGPLLVTALADGLASAGLDVGPLSGAEAGLRAWLQDGTIVAAGGLFAAPATGFNRGHIASKGNAKRRRPLTYADVRLVEVSELDYLGALPGWREALALRDLDGVPFGTPVDLSISERYYRVGAGVAGALTTIGTPLFGPAPSIDTPAELRARLATGRARSSVALVTMIAEELATRRGPLERRKALERYPIAFRDIVARAQRFLPAVSTSSETFRALLDRVRQQHRRDVAERARQLLATGMAELDVLTQLERERTAFETAAARRLEETLGAPPPPNGSAR